MLERHLVESLLDTLLSASADRNYSRVNASRCGIPSASVLARIEDAFADLYESTIKQLCGDHSVT